MGVIRIEQMEFYSYHGHYEEERIVGNRFLVDLMMETDCSAPAESDKLQDALDYQRAYELVRDEMKDKSFLLEHIAKRILDTLFTNFDSLEKAEVKVAKLNPPMGGKIRAVSVTLLRHKAQGSRLKKN
ncbi:MAG: dihydroneopterin aldolase [Bacteroidales bacterium]|nr:dihydroneopterin aldolase [Bacteroidales bacterium]